jgi:hypothetical protein
MHSKFLYNRKWRFRAIELWHKGDLSVKSREIEFQIQFAFDISYEFVI